jgi:hypothetical protein
MEGYTWIDGGIMSYLPKIRHSWVGHLWLRNWSDMALLNNREFYIAGIGIGWFGIGFVIGRKKNGV